MRKFWYPIRIFGANVFRRPLAALSALLSLLMLFLLLELIWTTMLSTENHYAKLISDIEMEAFFDESLSDSTVTELRKEILNFDEVENIDYISKESARHRLRDLMGNDLLEGLDGNPLPRSIILSFHGHLVTSDRLSGFAERLSTYDGVLEIHYPGNWLAETENTLQWLFWTTIALSLVILMTSGLNIVHSVRLTVRVRQEEIKQFKYLGAGPSIITQPFLLEGVFYALLASAISWFVIIYLKTKIIIPNIDIIIPELNHIIVSCLAAILMGMVGGYIGAKRSV